MSTEHWWHDTDSGKQKYWEENLSQYRFVHHKSHTDWPNIGHALQLQSVTAWAMIWPGSEKWPRVGVRDSIYEQKQVIQRRQCDEY